MDSESTDLLDHSEHDQSPATSADKFVKLEMDQLFNNLDSSQDGELAPEEIAALLVAGAGGGKDDGRRDAASSRILQIMNINHDDSVTKDEFMGWVERALDEAKAMPVEEFVTKLFVWLDGDNSGKIDVRELSAMLQRVLALTNDTMSDAQLVAL